MRDVQFFVPGTPVPKGSAKAFYNKQVGKAFAVQDNRERQKGWSSSISYVAHEQGFKPVEGPMHLEIIFDMPRPRSHYGTGKRVAVLKDSAPFYHTKKPDLDKLIRCAKDALTGVAWRDDSQVVEVRAKKRYGEEPGAWIVIGVKEDSQGG